jgi:phosphopantothenoylcysteine decarboxylase / phosphopantothenate---cysteine ligase
MKKKKILIGITASIAAYKAYDLIRVLQKEGAQVKCMATKDAMRFINKTTLEALLKDRVFDDLFGDYADKQAVHIALAEWADSILIMPASADMIAKCSCGIADDIVLATLLATHARVYFVPAMHSNMWTHAITQKNVETVKNMGATFIGPDTGILSDGTRGVGHIAASEEIIATLKSALSTTG